MHRMKIGALTATVALGVLTGVAGQARAQGVTAYEGARVIVGDGRVLDNTTLVVNGTKITQVGGGRACRRHAGQHRRQDRDADVPRHPHASEHDAR